jgi:hypothetical protein
MKMRERGICKRWESAATFEGMNSPWTKIYRQGQLQIRRENERSPNEVNCDLRKLFVQNCRGGGKCKQQDVVQYADFWRSLPSRRVYLLRYRGNALSSDRKSLHFRAHTISSGIGDLSGRRGNGSNGTGDNVERIKHLVRLC